MRDDFPEYKKGQDMDIVCRDMGKCFTHLLYHFRTLVPIKIHERGELHKHFDVMDGGSLELRFDLYGQIISERFTHELLEHKETMQFNGGAVCVPAPAYEGVIKCWEFLLNGKEKYEEYIIFRKTLDEYLI